MGRGFDWGRLHSRQKAERHGSQRAELYIEVEPKPVPKHPPSAVSSSSSATEAAPRDQGAPSFEEARRSIIEQQAHRVASLLRRYRTAAHVPEAIRNLSSGTAYLGWIIQQREFEQAIERLSLHGHAYGSGTPGEKVFNREAHALLKLDQQLRSLISDEQAPERLGGPFAWLVNQPEWEPTFLRVLNVYDATAALEQHRREWWKDRDRRRGSFAVEVKRRKRRGRAPGETRQEMGDASPVPNLDAEGQQ